MNYPGEYALLSLYVYSASKDFNRPLLPEGWDKRGEPRKDDDAGFSYGVFQKGGRQVVVAFTGTNQDIDWIANVASGSGYPSEQTKRAALVAAQAIRDYGWENVTFTGHSLGGGLASLMAVWFNRPAIVFDQAPFGAAASSRISTMAAKAYLESNGIFNAEFDKYDPVLSSVDRAFQVSNYYVQGEALQILRAVLPTICGSVSQPIYGNTANMGDPGGRKNLHSQALLSAFLVSDAFRQSTNASGQVLPRVMDSQLYAHDPDEGTERNFLIDMLRSEQQNPGSGKLTHFAADMKKLGYTVSGLSQAAQDAIIAQGIEWYYWQGKDYNGQEFMRVNNGVLQYTVNRGNDKSDRPNEYKASSYVNDWLKQILLNDLVAYSGAPVVPDTKGYEQWSMVGSKGGGVSRVCASVLRRASRVRLRSMTSSQIQHVRNPGLISQQKGWAQ